MRSRVIALTASSMLLFVVVVLGSTAGCKKKKKDPGELENPIEIARQALEKACDAGEMERCRSLGVLYAEGTAALSCRARPRGDPRQQRGR
jgi:hypothetical protein